MIYLIFGLIIFWALFLYYTYKGQKLLLPLPDITPATLPKISIIIAVKDGAKDLEETLKKLTTIDYEKLELIVWFMVLGADLFVSFYLPAFLVYSLAFAHVNYITHRKNASGEVEIINKNDNFYYQFINYIGSGVYFHKNHHNNPRVMNPMLLETNRKVL